MLEAEGGPTRTDASEDRETLMSVAEAVGLLLTGYIALLVTILFVRKI